MDGTIGGSNVPRHGSSWQGASKEDMHSTLARSSPVTQGSSPQLQGLVPRPRRSRISPCYASGVRMAGQAAGGYTRLLHARASSKYDSSSAGVSDHRFALVDERPSANTLRADDAPESELSERSSFSAEGGPVIVWNALLWDRFPDGDRLGGIAVNVAVRLAELGTHVAPVVRVGNDELGHAAVEQLSARGVDTSLVQIDDERRTGHTIVSFENDEPRFENQPGCAWEWLEMTENLAQALHSARAFVFGTATQRSEHGRKALADGLAELSPSAPTLFDPNLRRNIFDSENDLALTQGLARANVLKLSRNDVELIGERLGIKDDPVAALLRSDTRLPYASDRRLVVVTDAASGSCWFANNMQLNIPAAPAQPGGDPVGCGDAYLAATVHGYVNGWPAPNIGSLASLISAEVASTRGATQPISAERLSEIYGQSAPDTSNADS